MNKVVWTSRSYKVEGQPAFQLQIMQEAGGYVPLRKAGSLLGTLKPGPSKTLKRALVSTLEEATLAAAGVDLLLNSPRGEEYEGLLLWAWENEIMVVVQDGQVIKNLGSWTWPPYYLVSLCQEEGPSVLAHELGHCLAYFRGLDMGDERLAWRLGEEICIESLGYIPRDFYEWRAIGLHSYGLVA